MDGWIGWMDGRLLRIGFIGKYDESRSMADWTGTYRRRRTEPLVPLEDVT